MKSVEKTALLMHSAHEMYGLVTDIERYPEFLPWCEGACILATHPQGVEAQLSIAFKGLSYAFSTHNTYQQGQSVEMRLKEGLFSHLYGRWTFTDLASDAHPKACRIDFRLEYAFRYPALAFVIGPFFDKIAASMVQAFIERAHKIYAQ